MFPMFQPGDPLGLGYLNSKYKDKRHYRALDMRQAVQIYHYYYRKEPWISICKRAKYQMVFKGEVSVSWGDGALCSSDAEDPIAHRELVSLLQRALDYRDMFGMCPVKILPHPDGLRKQATVPEFGTGMFLSVLDLRTLQVRVLFVPHTDFGAKWNDAQQLERSALPVYVWPGSEPDSRTGLFSSRVFTLMNEYLAVEELRSNALDADFENSHPTIFTQARPETKDPAQLTEEEMFGDADDPELSANERQTYRRSSIRAAMLEALMRANNTSVKHSAESDSQSVSQWKREVDQDTSTVVQRKRKRVWVDNIEALPAGEEMASQILPKPRADFLRWRDEYEEAVCLQMGTPKRYVTGQMGKFAADAQQQQDLIRSAVEADREDVAMFYEWAYECMYRDGDNLAIAEKLMDLCNDKQRLLEGKRSDGKSGAGQQQQPPQQQQVQRRQQLASELRRLRAQKRLWKRIATMPNRASLVFREDPFPRIVDLNALDKAIERGAATRLEQINLLRSRLSLEIIDERHELFQASNDDDKDGASTQKARPQRQERPPVRAQAQSENREGPGPEKRQKKDRQRTKEGGR